MDAKSFAYWLQGFVELNGEPPTPEQWELIKEHLALVFNKVTPKLGESKPLEPFTPDWTLPNDHIPYFPPVFRPNKWHDPFRPGGPVITC